MVLCNSDGLLLLLNGMTLEQMSPNARQRQRLVEKTQRRITFTCFMYRSENLFHKNNMKNIHRTIVYCGNRDI